MGDDKAAIIRWVVAAGWNGCDAQARERLGREVGALESQIRLQPENDRMTRRYRQGAATPASLTEKDAVRVDGVGQYWKCGGDAILAS